MSEQSPASNGNTDMETVDAAKKILETHETPSTEAEIADYVGSSVWELADRVAKLAPAVQALSDKPAVAIRTVRLPDGGALKARLALGARSVTFTDAEGNKVHTASAGWKHGTGPIQRHTDVSTETVGDDGILSMRTQDKSGVGEYDSKIEMHISDDPREWKQRFEPATEGVRIQALANATTTLTGLQGAVEAAEIANHAQQELEESQT